MLPKGTDLTELPVNDLTSAYRQRARCGGCRCCELLHTGSRNVPQAQEPGESLPCPAQLHPRSLQALQQCSVSACITWSFLSAASLHKARLSPNGMERGKLLEGRMVEIAPRYSAVHIVMNMYEHE